MTDYCRAVLRPEGIACTLPAGHLKWGGPGGWDHVNLVQRWTDGRPTREGIEEWGFNNPLGRKLEDDGRPKLVRVDNRDPDCVEAWPECYSFGYDPRCCRFPKSCSAGGVDWVPLAEPESDAEAVSDPTEYEEVAEGIEPS